MALAAACLLLLLWKGDGIRERLGQHWRGRELVATARGFGPAQALLIGDSVAAGAPLTSLCGRRLLNAGIGGTGVREWRRLAPRLVAAARPSVVVIAIGINDVARGGDPDAWEQGYRALVAAAGGARVAVVPILPAEPDKRAISARDRGAWRALNVRIARIARETGALAVPPLASTSGLTVDGVHLNAEGYRLWQARLESSCARLVPAGMESGTTPPRSSENDLPGSVPRPRRLG